MSITTAPPTVCSIFYLVQDPSGTVTPAFESEKVLFLLSYDLCTMRFSRALLNTMNSMYTYLAVLIFDRPFLEVPTSRRPFSTYLRY